jgi:hypothetical protein
MQKLALAAVAAICLSGTAFAGQATKPAAMTDTEMDKVTAGDVGGNPHDGSNGLGNAWGKLVSGWAPNAGGLSGGNIYKH